MEFKLPSGAQLSITLLDFEQAFEISQTVTRFIGLLELDIKSLNIEQWKSFSDIDFNAIKRPLSQVLSNGDLVKAGNKCLNKCTYNGKRITDQTWQDIEARKDYLYAIFYGLKENVYPFFAGVFSSLKA